MRFSHEVMQISEAALKTHAGRHEARAGAAWSARIAEAIGRRHTESRGCMLEAGRRNAPTKAKMRCKKAVP
jgi:hypothetical protein